MGCGISKFERRHHEDGDLTTTASGINHPQPQVVDSEDGVKEKESSPSPSWPRLGGGGGGLEGIKIKEDADHNNHDDDDEQGDDSLINYPRSPSFREYCTDSELPFGNDSSPDKDGTSLINL